ncbi:unnamed protein product [Parnassius apollo]|uniref:(apollo) hypothetical protein n=1 Tax=Parnassius apollo TaxID=110799 RepID=A0A8S3W2N2_PARAO|nr:unnamed protein product [Parnassius apollo]
MAIAAIHFRTICLESAKQWSHITSCLSQIDTPNAEDKTYFIFYDKTDFLPVLKVQKEVRTVPQAVSKLNQKPQPPSRDKKRTVKKFKSKRNGLRWKCKDCGKEFTLPSYLNQHLRMTMKRACTHCGKIVGREKLHQHLANAHNIHLYHCKSCHQLFQEEHELEQHTQTAHSVFSYVCHVCNNGFINDRALNAHMYAHTLFHCQSCSSSFENRRCYKYHISRCGGSKRQPESLYECHDCGSKYKKKESLRTHIEQKHLNVLPFICQKCGKRSSNLGHHRAHESIHMTERKVFQCYCGAKMLTQLGFNLHQRNHSGVKPYECSVCGDRFLSSSRRLDHIKRRHISTKDFPHGCEKCPAKFIRPSQLKKHYQVAHCT